MRRTAALALALALAAAAPAAAAEALEIVEVDTSGYPQVSVTVAVPASLQGLDLTADAFTVVEDGYAVDAGVWAWVDDPLAVVLVLDTSGSMAGGAIADARDAASAFVAVLPPDAAVAVVSSGGAAAVRSPLDGGRDGARAAISALTAGGETALYDAVGAGAALLDGVEANPVVVVLSDGGDTVSASTEADAVAALESSGAEVFVIGLQTDETDGAALAALAGAGGGRVVSIDEASLLGEAFGGIAGDLAGRYRLAYRSRAHGEVDLVVAVRTGDLSAAASAALDLPAAPLPAGGPTEERTTSAVGVGEAVPAIAPAPSLLAQPWARPAGVGASVAGAAALLALVASGGGRTRRPVERQGTRRGRLLRLLTRRAEDVTEKVLQSRTPGRLERDLDRAGVALRPTEFVLLSVSAGVAAVAGSLLLLSPPAAVGVALLAALAPRAALRVLTARRRAAFADQFEGTLQMLSGSLRAGYGLMQAAATIAEEAPAPTGPEFARVAVENRLGRSVEDSLRALSERMENEDLRWVVEAIDIQYEVGGDLAEVLDTVAETIRDRDQVRRQVRALSAEGRISAVVLVSMPFAIAVLISMVSPDYLAELTGTTLGKFMIGGALVMIGLGAAWIRKIVKVVF